MEVSTIDEKLKWGWGEFYFYPVAAACVGLEAGAVCSQRNCGRKEVLKHPTETNTAIQYGLLGCIDHEATRNSTYKATLNVTGLAMLTVCPSHGPPPSLNTVYHFQIYFTLNIAHQLLFLLFSSRHSIFK